MTRILHLVEMGRAPWSALAAIAAMQSADDATGLQHVVLAPHDPVGRRRAALAGVDLRQAPASRRSALGHADAVVPWDESARQWLDHRRHGARIVAPRTPIPIQSRLFDRHPRQTLRDRLSLPTDRALIALLSAPGDKADVERFATLLTAVGLAGFHVVGVALNDCPLDELVESMRFAGDGATLVARVSAPWSILPACDLALSAEPIESAGPVIADLVRWARAAGTPALAPEASDANVSATQKRRFQLARQLVAALTAPTNDPASPAGANPDDDCAFGAWLDEFTRRIDAAPAHP